MAAPGFWDNPPAAQDLVAQLRRLTLEIKPLKELQSAADDLAVLMEFAVEDKTGGSTRELAAAADALAEKLAAVELQAMLSRPEDAFGAYLSVQAGEGGTDASDWAAMLLRMYQRWAEDNGFATELLDLSEAEEAGIRSAALAIRGDYAFGHLRGEVGVHRLIRISPFDAAGRRQTSFAAIDLVPELNDDAEIQIDWDKDVREDVFPGQRQLGTKGQQDELERYVSHAPADEYRRPVPERAQSAQESGHRPQAARREAVPD